MTSNIRIIVKVCFFHKDKRDSVTILAECNFFMALPRFLPNFANLRYALPHQTVLFWQTWCFMPLGLNSSVELMMNKRTGIPLGLQHLLIFSLSSHI